MRCRIDKTKCKIFLDLGKMPMANGFVDSKSLNNEYFYKLQCAFNKKLSLFQLVNFPTPGKMFNKNYPFYTSSSRFMIKHFENFSKMLKKKYLKKIQFYLKLGQTMEHF